MWIFTERGFFSTVLADPDKVTGLPTDVPYVMVRARVRSDLVSLLELVGGADLESWGLRDRPEILEWVNRDYPYRVLMALDLWATLLGRMGAGIEYTNFKDHVKEVQGSRRSSIYGRIWSVMFDVERYLTRKQDDRRQGHFDYWPASMGRHGAEPEYDDFDSLEPEPPGDLLGSLKRIVDKSMRARHKKGRSR